MIIKVPVVKIVSIRSYKLGEDYPFKVEIRVEQDDDTSVNFPFLPFEGNGNLKKDHPIFLGASGRQASRREVSFSVITKQEAESRETNLFQDIKLLLETWLADIESIREWESTHTEYDSSKVDEKKPE